MAGGEVDEWYLPPGTTDPWPNIPGPPKGMSVAIDFLDGPGPKDARVLAVVDGLALRVRLARSAEGDVRCEGPIEVDRRDGGMVTATDWQALGLGAVHRTIEALMAHEWVVEHLGDEWGAVRVPRPGRRGRDPLYYAVVARDYVRALVHEPKRPVRWMIDNAPGHVTDDEVRARVRRARRLGLLTDVPAGRAGGELTAKALDLLRDAGLLEEGDDDGKR